MAKRRRRSVEDVNRAAMKMARSGPFASGDLSKELGFSPNRARQVIEQLKSDGQVVELGKRRSVRGKPSTLYGLPGTKVTDADRAPRAPARSSARRAEPTPAIKGARAVAKVQAMWDDFHPLQTLVNLIADHGVEMHAPGGLIFKFRIDREPGAAPRGRPRKAAAKRKARKPAAKAAAQPEAAAEPRAPAPRKAAATKRAATKRKAIPKKPVTRAKKAASRKTPARKTRTARGKKRS